MKIVVLGAWGFVGGHIMDRLNWLPLNTAAFVGLRRIDHDYTKPDILARLITTIKPDFLVNAAGYTGKPNVDACEIHQDECWQANVDFPAMVGAICAEHKLPWLHVSSGCIYDGTRNDGTGYTETDTPNYSESFYSRSKMAGEARLLGLPDTYVMRIRIPFCGYPSPRNYITKLLRYERLVDVENSMTCLETFASNVWTCIRNRPEPGIYNMTETGTLTTREATHLIETVATRFSGKKRAFKFFASYEEFRSTVKTGRSNCILDNHKARASGFYLPDIRESFTRTLIDYGF